MATIEQTSFIIDKLKESKPVNVMKKAFDMESGMQFVLLELIESKVDVYASAISEKMCTSRARVGALLEKMENKGLISRKKSANDARIEVVSLTEKGFQKANGLKTDIVERVNQIIDVVGFNEIRTFLEIASKIKSAVI